MYTFSSRRIVATLVVVCSIPSLFAAGSPHIALTSDVAGHVGPCLTCPGTTDLGGLVRRTAAGQSVAGVENPLRLDAGGFLFGDADPSFFVEAYAATDLDAINPGTADFRRGLEYTRELVEGAGLPVTSANLRDEGGQPLFASFLVAERGGHKAAIIGVTERPAALDYLPHLQDQLAGITIMDPARAVADVLPAAEEAADRIVLLVYGSARTVESLRDAFGDRVDVIGVGGARPRDFERRAFEGPGPVVLSSKSHGTHVTVYAEGMDHPHVIPVTEDLPADPAVEAVVEKEEQKKRERAQAMEPLLPTSMPAAGTAVRVLGSDANQGLGLTVYEWRTEDVWQGTEASENSRFLILDVAIANQLHPRLTQELEYAEAVQVASLRNKAFLVMNGRRIIRHPERAHRFAGHLPDSFVIPTPGRAAEGQLVFELPDQEIEELDLVLYHDEFPSLAVQLLGTEAPKADAAAPVARGKNEVLALELHSVTKSPSTREGFQRVVLDLRGQSTMSRQADSSALDSMVAVEDNQPVDHAIPLDYSYFSDLIALELPEDRSISPTMRESEFPDLPAFLPDRMAGGRVVFEVPDEFAEHAFRLKAWFPTMILAGDGAGEPVNPEAITLEIQPGREIRTPPPQLTFSDGDLSLDLLVIEALEEISGHRAPEDHQWVRALLRLENDGDVSGLMPMTERFGLRRDRERITFETSGSVLSPFHPPSHFYLPAGEARVFELVFKVPLDWPEAYFDYRGVTSNPGRLIDFDSPNLIADQESVEFEFDPDTESGPAPLQPPGGEGTPRQGGGFELAVYSMPGDESSIDFTPAIYSETLESTPPESRIEVGVRAENDRLRITVDHAYVFTQTEAGELPEEEVMVGVHLRIERRETYDEPVSIRFLNQYLFGVSQLRKLHTLHSDRSIDPQISHRFVLDDGTPVVEGIALFKINTSDLSHFELHWLDEEFGNSELPIFPGGEGRIESPAAVFTDANAITELGVYGMEFRDSYGEQRVEDGRWLVLDVRGRSVRQTAETAGGGGGVGTRLSWRDWMLRTQLIVNGDQVFDLNRHRTDIEDPFLMLPGRAVGGEIAFQVPDEVLASAESIEWVAGFGAYAIPGERVMTPKPLRMQLQGERPGISLPEESLAECEDEDFDLYVVRAERPESFMGQSSRGGAPWVVVEGVVRAKAEAGVDLRPLDVLQLVNPAYAYFNPSVLVWGGSDQQESRGSSQWIAPGDVRRFQMAWRLRSEHTPYRLRYRGMRKYQTIPLGEAFALEGDEDPVDPETDRHISEKGLRVLYPDRIPEGIAGVGLEPQQVNSAIDRGQAFLWKELREEWAGRGRVHRMTYIYPMLYALVNTELHLENPEFDQALREFLDQVRPDEQTIYENGLLAMILRAYGDPDYVETLKQTVHYFVEAQGENGTWSYRAETPRRFFVREEPVESADGLLIAGGENPETAAEKLEDPVYRTQSFTLGTEGDNSCTQFAVLGLWSAQRAGIKVDTDVWRRVLRSATDFQDYRNSDSFGGYAYGGGGTSYGSMTSAVLCTTALALRQLDAEVNVAEHLRIRNALGWLVANFSVEENVPRNRYNYYYLYSLERVGQILGTEFIGDYEWYPLGARYLVDAQSGDGGWPTGPGEGDSLLTTSYALLFLTRATPKMDEDLTPDPDEPGRLLTQLQRPEVQNRVYLILDASGSMRDDMQGREKFELAREAVGAMLESMPENTEVALRVYGHRLRAIERGADEDSELVLPWSPLDVPAFKETLQALTPMGRTPLTLSLTQAAREVTSRRSEGQTVLMLLTDGGESDRSADPVEAARALADKEDVQFFILGFDINREDWTRQLLNMAEAGNGVYRPVEDANLLTRELISVVYPPAPHFDFASDEGEIRKSGILENREFSVKPGKYTFTLHPGGEKLKQTLWIRPGGTTRIQYTLDPTRTPVRTVEATIESPTESESTRSSFCTQCGTPLSETTRFCTNCGARVSE